MVQPRRRKAGISSNSALLSWPLPRGGAMTCSGSTGQVATAARDGIAGVMIARVDRLRRGRRDRRRCIRVHGRGECRGAAIGHGGSLDALDDGLNRAFMGCCASTGAGSATLSAGSASASGAPDLRGVAVGARWIGATVGVIASIFRRIAQRLLPQSVAVRGRLSPRHQPRRCRGRCRYRRRGSRAASRRSPRRGRRP